MVNSWEDHSRTTALSEPGSRCSIVLRPACQKEHLTNWVCECVSVSQLLINLEKGCPMPVIVVAGYSPFENKHYYRVVDHPQRLSLRQKR